MIWWGVKDNKCYLSPVETELTPLATKEEQIPYQARTEVEEIVFLDNVVFDNDASPAYFFQGFSKITSLDASKFQIDSNAEGIFTQWMFQSCYSLEELDLSHLDVSNIWQTSGMFQYCHNLKKLNLSGWDTSKVEEMQEMFDECKSLEQLDLSSFDMSKVTKTYYMFHNCSNLKTIYANNWYFENFPYSRDDGGMFTNCRNLMGRNGVKYTSSNTKASMANYETGYFTNPNALPIYFGDKRPNTIYFNDNKVNHLYFNDNQIF